MLPRRRRTGSENENLITSNERSLSKAGELNYINSCYPNNVSQNYYLEDNHIEDYVEPEPIMTARDRTSEFANTIQTLQACNSASYSMCFNVLFSRVVILRELSQPEILGGLK